MKSPVSIRASLQQRGEPIQQRAPIFSTSFNPRLTSAARRTNELIHNLSCVAFQSAPHFSSEANPVVKRGRPRKVVFQSAPHFSSEANIAVFHAVGVRYSFQSAPHFSSEANDCSIFDMSFHRWVSIRASLQQRGERQLTAQVLWAKLVSIRASLQQRGELRQSVI